jgi:hypothetical protein
MIKLFNYAAEILRTLHVLPGVLLIYLFSCAVSQTYVEELDISGVDYDLEKILVLHLGGIHENREVIEGELTYWLSRNGINAHPSYKFSSGTNLPEKAELQRIIGENEFDGVLITRLENIEATNRYENAQQRYGTSPVTPEFYNYLDAYKNQYSAGYNFIQLIYVVNTELHAVQGKQLIFRSTTETRETDTEEFAVEEFSRSIAKELVRSELLKKKILRGLCPGIIIS